MLNKRFAFRQQFGNCSYHVEEIHQDSRPINHN